MKPARATRAGASEAVADTSKCTFMNMGSCILVEVLTCCMEQKIKAFWRERRVCIPVFETLVIRVMLLLVMMMMLMK